MAQWPAYCGPVTNRLCASLKWHDHFRLPRRTHGRAGRDRLVLTAVRSSRPCLGRARASAADGQAGGGPDRQGRDAVTHHREVARRTLPHGCGGVRQVDAQEAGRSRRQHGVHGHRRGRTAVAHGDPVRRRGLDHARGRRGSSTHHTRPRTQARARGGGGSWHHDRQGVRRSSTVPSATSGRRIAWTRRTRAWPDDRSRRNSRRARSDRCDHAEIHDVGAGWADLRKVEPQARPVRHGPCETAGSDLPFVRGALHSTTHRPRPVQAA